MRKRTIRALCALALAALCLLPGRALAAEGKYADLPESHWAYSSMDRAAALGVIQGVGGGYMAPEDTLTWGQYLVMLTRTFYPDQYAASLGAGLDWDLAGYVAALRTGLVAEDDTLPVDANRLDQPILRRDAAVLLARAVPGEAARVTYWWDPSVPPTAEESFTDWNTLTGEQQEAVSRLFDLSVIQGRDDGTFDGGASIRRSDGTVLLMRVIEVVDRVKGQEEQTVVLHLVDRQGSQVAPDQTVTARPGQYTRFLLDDTAVPGYTYLEGSVAVSSVCGTYTLVLQPSSPFEAAEAAFRGKIARGEATWDEYWEQDFWIYAPGENSQKYQRLFGNTNTRRFSSRQEAEAHMTTVTVPVWHLDSAGNKMPATASFSIHEALADEMVAIFTEIYNDPEQFPIHDLGGYSWRGDSATGEHNCGTAVDLNANENYQVRDGRAEAGSHWTPGSDPYSIPADGSVVRVFTAHGWTWGGDAWAWDTDPSTGYHDYMHFSYMGE